MNNHNSGTGSNNAMNRIPKPTIITPRVKRDNKESIKEFNKENVHNFRSVGNKEGYLELLKSKRRYSVGDFPLLSKKKKSAAVFNNHESSPTNFKRNGSGRPSINIVDLEATEYLEKEKHSLVNFLQSKIKEINQDNFPSEDSNKFASATANETNTVGKIDLQDLKRGSISSDFSKMSKPKDSTTSLVYTVKNASTFKHQRKEVKINTEKSNKKGMEMEKFHSSPDMINLFDVREKEQLNPYIITPKNKSCFDYKEKDSFNNNGKSRSRDSYIKLVPLECSVDNEPDSIVENIRDNSEAKKIVNVNSSMEVKGESKINALNSSNELLMRLENKSLVLLNENLREVDKNSLSNSKVYNKKHTLSPVNQPKSIKIYTGLEEDRGANISREKSDMRVSSDVCTEKESYRKIKRSALVYDSLSDEEEEVFYNECYIDPDSRFKRIWDNVIMVLSVYSFLIVPMELSILKISFNLLLIDLFIDIILNIDLILHFFLAFHTFVDESIVRDFKSIYIKYLTGWFIFDLVAAVPFNTIYNFQKYANPKITIQICFLLRTLRLLKFYKMAARNKFNFHHNVKVIDEMNITSSVSRVLRFFFYLLMLIHMLSCVWKFLGELTRPNWILSANLENSTDGEIYLAAVYYLFSTIFTIGYGDIVCKNLYERFFTMFLLIFGVVVYSFALSSLSNMIISGDEKTLRFYDKMDMLSRFRHKYKFSGRLYVKIARFLKYDLQINKKDKNELLNSLPLPMRNELLTKMYSDIIYHFVFFKDLHTSNYDFIMRVVSSFRPMYAPKNEEIVQQGDFFSEIIFVKKGILALEVEFLIFEQEDGSKLLRKELIPKQKKSNLSGSLLRPLGTIKSKSSVQVPKEIGRERVKIIEIRKNEHFGDVLMFWNKRSPISIKVKSKTAEMLMLRKYELIKISADYPDILEKIFRISTFNWGQIKLKIKRVEKGLYSKYKSLVDQKQTTAIDTISELFSMESSLSDYEKKRTESVDSFLKTDPDKKPPEKNANQSIIYEVGAENESEESVISHNNSNSSGNSIKNNFHLRAYNSAHKEAIAPAEISNKSLNLLSSKCQNLSNTKLTFKNFVNSSNSNFNGINLNPNQNANNHTTAHNSFSELTSDFKAKATNIYLPTIISSDSNLRNKNLQIMCNVNINNSYNISMDNSKSKSRRNDRNNTTLADSKHIRSVEIIDMLKDKLGKSRDDSEKNIINRSNSEVVSRVNKNSNNRSINDVSNIRMNNLENKKKKESDNFFININALDLTANDIINYPENSSFSNSENLTNRDNKITSKSKEQQNRPVNQLISTSNSAFTIESTYPNKMSNYMKSKDSISSVDKNMRNKSRLVSRHSMFNSHSLVNNSTKAFFGTNSLSQSNSPGKHRVNRSFLNPFNNTLDSSFSGSIGPSPNMTLNSRRRISESPVMNPRTIRRNSWEGKKRERYNSFLDGLVGNKNRRINSVMQTSETDKEMRKNIYSNIKNNEFLKEITENFHRSSLNVRMPQNYYSAIFSNKIYKMADITMRKLDNIMKLLSKNSDL